jgi:hypothetical protein
VRTTIELTAEAWHLAKAVARERNESLGKVVSEFILQRADSSLPLTRSKAGFPLFSSDKRVTSEDVRMLLDEDVDGD